MVYCKTANVIVGGLVYKLVDEYGQQCNLMFV